MKIANFLTDVKTLNIVIEEAKNILKDDPTLDKEENKLLKQSVNSKQTTL